MPLRDISSFVKILTDFLNSRKQKVVRNSQHLPWCDVLDSASQGLIRGPVLFLIYINDLSEGLQRNPKLSADDLNNDFKQACEFIFPA